MTSCLIHQEVRIEFILFAVELLKKINCLRSLPCMSCLDSDYIRQLRYKHLDPRAASTSVVSQVPSSRIGGGGGNGSQLNGGTGARRTSPFGEHSLLNLSQIDEERPMLPSTPSTIAAAQRLKPSSKKKRYTPDNKTETYSNGNSKRAKTNVSRSNLEVC